jgi:hypothetical protein
MPDWSSQWLSLVCPGVVVLGRRDDAPLMKSPISPSFHAPCAP